MSFTNSTRFEMLNKSNYDTWKIQVEALLIKNDTWSYVSGEKPKPQITGEGEARAVTEEEQKKWIAADRKAKSDLILAMNASELRQIRSCETSREIWMKLESIYESKGPARKATLLKQLIQHKMREDDDVREHVAKFMDTVDKLQGMNIEINGDLLSIMLLYSLPSSFENFRCAIESRDSLPHVENLKVKIVEENDARNQKLDGSSTGGVMFSKHFSRDSNSSKDNYKKQDEKSSKPKITYKCNYCGKRGHKAADCFKKKREENQKAGLVHEAYFSGKTNDKWCLDSGCTSHICNDKELFINSEKAQCQLKLASNATTQAIAKGSVNILTSVGNQAKKIELKNTLYAPDFRTNLLSIAKIVDKNREVLFTKNRAFIQDRRGRVKMIADRDGDLFYLRENHQKACATSVTMTCDIFNNWHRRFGHLNFKDLEVMMKENLVTGAKLKGTVSTNNPCKICISGKFATAPFPRRPNRSSNLLDIVHTDVCGPMRIESKGGARYFVTFTDDYSRWTQTYLIRKKPEVASKFREYKNFVETQLERKIKAVQSDNGKEYCNKEMDKIFRDSCIQRRLTTVYSPQQNGLAERKNRTLVEAARCMLLESGLPASFWGEAIMTANHVRNRCISKSIDGDIPYERWTGKSPDVSHLQIFGCKAYVLDKSTNRGKFDSKTVEGIFVGYSDYPKGYRVWIPSEQKIRISRDVKFFEEFKSNEYEDIISSETLNGRFKLSDVLGNMDPSGRVDIDICGGENSPEETKAPTVNMQEIPLMQENFEEDEIAGEIVTPDEEIEKMDDAIKTKRGPGRPRKILTGKVGRPKKQYHTIYNQNLPVVVDRSNIEPTSNEDPRYEEIDFVMAASEIPFSEAIHGADKDEWKDAILSEIKSLVINDTWDVVDKPVHAKVVGCRTVLRNKYAADGTLDRRKARVVAKGFTQRPGIDFHDTFAPVARLSSLRLLVALAARYNLKISQLDVTSAYLNGKIDTEVFMEKPALLQEMLQRIINEEEDDHTLVKKARVMLRDLQGENKICRLRKALYGLRQAGRQWNYEIDKTMKRAGLVPTNADPCVYVDKNTRTFVLIYVDDILIISGNQERERQIKDVLSKVFRIKDFGLAKYCLGIQIEQNENEICLSQAGYIREILKRYRMEDCKPVLTPLAVGSKLSELHSEDDNEDTNFPFRELIGALMYVAVGTRPDVSHAVSVLSQFSNCYRKKHCTAAKRVLRYLKGTIDKKLIYRKNQDNLTCYVDADWANCEIDRRSYTGSTFILSGAAFSWESRKQRTVALSSTEAEYMALSDASKEAVFLIGYLKELGFQSLANVVVFNDNQGAGKLTENSVYHARSKHIDVRYHFIRDAVKKHPIKILYLPTEKMIADVLTKALPKENHDRCILGLGL
jgi:hypothetical protein